MTLGKRSRTKSLSLHKTTLDRATQGQMANIPFSYEDYERTRIQLVEEIYSRLTNMDRLFLLSFKEGIPDWEKLPVKNVQELPAVQWKLQNIEKIKQMNHKKHMKMVRVLKEMLLL